MNKILHSILFTLVIVANNAHATCSEKTTVIGVKYKITIRNEKNKIINTHEMNLWRKGNQVAQEYLDTGITEVWEKTKTGMLRLVRNFDKQKRAIEYQPNEINKGQGERDWSLKSQLVSDKYIKLMQQKSTQGEACNKSEFYTLKNKNKLIEIDWLGQRRLVRMYRETTPAGKTEWNLTQVIFDKETITKIFSNRDNYQSTDYTDIGDNESDPFLISMINLGFVEHSASGFYDANGNTLEGNNSHGHHKH